MLDCAHNTHDNIEFFYLKSHMHWSFCNIKWVFYTANACRHDSVQDLSHDSRNTFFQSTSLRLARTLKHLDTRQKLKGVLTHVAMYNFGKGEIEYVNSESLPNLPYAANVKYIACLAYKYARHAITH